MNAKRIRCFYIVVADNQISKYYYRKSRGSWIKNGFNIRVFDASTPHDYHEQNLVFLPSTASKYSKKGIVKEYTESEKAAFTSHYRLWKKIAVENIHDNLIIEHDARLRDFELFEKEWDESINIVDVKLFGQGASCYRISPRAARKVVGFIEERNKNVEGGPMFYFADTSGSVFKNTDLTFDRTFERLGGEINLPVEHIYNPVMGNTLDRYANLDPKWKKHFKDLERKISKKRWVYIGEDNE